MGVLSKTGAVLVLLVALLLCFAGYAGAQAPAQYGTTPAGQYGPSPGDQYDSSPAGTTTLREDQYATAPEEQPGGGTTTAPVGSRNDGGNGKGGKAGIVLPQRQPPDAGKFPRLLDGFLADAATLLAVLSLLTTVVFFLERSGDRPE